jgi:hypothetical protein
MDAHRLHLEFGFARSSSLWTKSHQILRFVYLGLSILIVLTKVAFSQPSAHVCSQEKIDEVVNCKHGIQ